MSRGEVLRVPSENVRAEGVNPCYPFGMPFEVQFLQGIQSVVLSTPWMIALVIFFARWCILVNIVPMVTLLGSRKERDRHSVVEAVWSALLAMSLTSLFSFFIQRARPFFDHQEILLLIPPPFNTSFPSGHTATAVALALAMLYVDRTMGLVSIVIAGFVAYGRMAVGVHYPSDIVGGILVGALAFYIVRVIHHQLERKDIERSAKKHHHS